VEVSGRGGGKQGNGEKVSECLHTGQRSGWGFKSTKRGGGSAVGKTRTEGGKRNLSLKSPTRRRFIKRKEKNHASNIKTNLMGTL